MAGMRNDQTSSGSTCSLHVSLPGCTPALTSSQATLTTSPVACQPASLPMQIPEGSRGPYFAHAQRHPVLEAEAAGCGLHQRAWAAMPSGQGLTKPAGWFRVLQLQQLLAPSSVLLLFAFTFTGAFPDMDKMAA